MKDDFFRANPISLDPDNPLYQQLYTHLQTAVLTGDLKPGMRLPSTRALAILLNVSRHTVLNAYQQLIAEGYLVSMSLDGFVTAANVRPEAGLGDGGERLHDWAFNSADPRNRELLAKGASLGGIISGRHNYDLAVPYWGADGPTGDARVPTIVVSHSVPQDIPHGGVYSFADGIEAALEKAQEAAGDKDVAIHLVPVLFGSGIRLFEHLDSEHVQLETMEVIETIEAIHLRFRVIK